MATKKVTISVPAKVYARASKKAASFSGYVTDLIVADLAREDMQKYVSELETTVGVTEDDRRWAREQLAKKSRKAG